MFELCLKWGDGSANVNLYSGFALIGENAPRMDLMFTRQSSYWHP